MLPLLIPPRLSRLAGYLGSLFGREFFGASLAAFEAAESAEFLRGFVFLSHAVMVACTVKQGKDTLRYSNPLNSLLSFCVALDDVLSILEVI